MSTNIKLQYSLCEHFASELGNINITRVACGTAFTQNPKGRGFESWPVRFQVIALGKQLTCMCLCHQAV